MATPPLIKPITPRTENQDVRGMIAQREANQPGQGTHCRHYKLVSLNIKLISTGKAMNGRFMGVRRSRVQFRSSTYAYARLHNIRRLMLLHSVGGVQDYNSGYPDPRGRTTGGCVNRWWIEMQEQGTGRLENYGKYSATSDVMILSAMASGTHKSYYWAATMEPEGKMKRPSRQGR